MKMEQSVPKHRQKQSVLKCQHIKFRRWGITQKKTYNNQMVIITVCKGKVYPRTGREGPEGVEVYCTHSLTLMLDGGGLSKPDPGHSTPGKEHPLYIGWVGPQGWSGQ